MQPPPPAVLVEKYLKDRHAVAVEEAQVQVLGTWLCLLPCECMLVGFAGAAGVPAGIARCPPPPYHGLQAAQPPPRSPAPH